jgi:hypothetical protein
LNDHQGPPSPKYFQFLPSHAEIGRMRAQLEAVHDSPKMTAPFPAGPGIAAAEHYHQEVVVSGEIKAESKDPLDQSTLVVPSVALSETSASPFAVSVLGPVAKDDSSSGPEPVEPVVQIAVGPEVPQAPTDVIARVSLDVSRVKTDDGQGGPDHAASELNPKVPVPPALSSTPSPPGDRSFLAQMSLTEFLFYS